MWRQRSKASSDTFDLMRLRRELIDLEYTGLVDSRQPIGTAIESGAQQDDLAYVLVQRTTDRVIEQPCPGNRRGARSRPPFIDDTLDESAQICESAQRHSRARPWPQEGISDWIVKEAFVCWPPRLEGSKERHHFGGATRIHG